MSEDKHTNEGTDQSRNGNAADDILASGASGGRGSSRGKASGSRRRSFSKGSVQEALAEEQTGEHAAAREEVSEEAPADDEAGTGEEAVTSTESPQAAPEAPEAEEVTSGSGAGHTDAPASDSDEAQDGPTRIDPHHEESSGLDPVVDDLSETFTVSDTDDLLARIAEISPQTRALNKTTVNLSHKHAAMLDDVKRQLKIAGFNGNQATTSNVMAVGLSLYKRILELDRQRSADY